MRVICTKNEANKISVWTNGWKGWREVENFRIREIEKT